ncbi:hypothetical protein J4440_00095 [Candidatus Woesearchaeota archaeon]|nr:hypothetical protein [Candidatus Woesearchaeota archaeon]
MISLNVYFNHVNSPRELERILQDKLPITLSVIPEGLTKGSSAKKYPK